MSTPLDFNALVYALEHTHRHFQQQAVKAFAIVGTASPQLQATEKVWTPSKETLEHFIQHEIATWK